MSHSRISNQDGMGLVPFLVMTGVVGIIVAGMASSILTMIRSQTSVSATTEAALLTDQLKASLTNEAACANALANKTPDNVAPGADPVTALNGVAVRLADTDMTLGEGTALVDSTGKPLGYTLHRFRMTYDDPPAVGVINSAVSPPMLNDGPDPVWNKRIRIVLQLQKTGEGIFSPMSQKKEFFIDANVRQADGKIKSCAARSVASEACFQMGGIWNPSVDAALPVDGNRCQSNQFCQYGGSYSDLSTPPQALFQNTMMDPPGYGCPAGFTAKQTGAVALASADSKSNLSTTVAPIYSCLRCAQQDRSTFALNAFAATDTLAASYVTAANSETDAAIATNTTLSSPCNAALSTAGRWNVSYASSDCGPISGAPPSGGVCDPRTAPMSGYVDCSYVDPMSGTYISLSSSYNATCVDTVPLPSYCHYP